MRSGLPDVYSELLETLVEKIWAPAVLSRGHVMEDLGGGSQRIFMSWKKRQRSRE